ncbi:MAG: histidine phosphatase family protein [Chloroflexi bacterium]|nr:histidine phosphatase family protein [Chloroflexota bacterium]
MLTLEIFVHMDAVDRHAWQGAADDRPLTPLGEQQSERIADELTAGTVVAIYSSQALRCRASLAPLSQRLSLPVQVLPGFQDTAEKAVLALNEIHAAVPDGRAVLCSYGDVVPALLDHLTAKRGQPAPARDNRKGAVFTLHYDGSTGWVESRGPTPGFPS